MAMTFLHAIYTTKKGIWLRILTSAWYPMALLTRALCTS